MPTKLYSVYWLGTYGLVATIFRCELPHIKSITFAKFCFSTFFNAGVTYSELEEVDGIKIHFSSL